MIRFFLGLILVMGGVGGLENDTATFTQAITTCLIGFALMLWALPKIVSQGESY
jgi:hypothetical protein